MKSTRFILTLIKALICIFFLAYGVPGYVDRACAGNIVAIVNRDSITQKELNDFIAFIRIQLSGDAGDDIEAEKKIETMKGDLLNKLIEDRLILQEAKKNKIEIDENRIKARIAEIKKRYPSDLAFHADLLKQGLSQGDIENKIKEQMLSFAVIEQKIRSKIVVRPEEVTDFYHKNVDKFFTSETRELEIFIFDNKTHASLFSYNFRIGRRIEELATRYPFILEQLKANSNDELRKEIRDVIFKLSLNEISDVVNIDEKYFVFRLINIIPPKEKSLTEAQDSIYAYLFDQKMQEEIGKWLEELKKQSYIKIIKN